MSIIIFYLPDNFNSKKMKEINKKKLLRKSIEKYEKNKIYDVVAQTTFQFIVTKMRVLVFFFKVYAVKRRLERLHCTSKSLPRH